MPNDPNIAKNNPTSSSHYHSPQASITPPAPHSVQTAANLGLSQLTEAQEKQLVFYNHITYLLYLLSFFTAGILWIVPIVMNYLKRREAGHSWLASHFDWQIKTFWYSILMAILGVIILLIGLGVLGVSIFTESGNTAAGSVVMTMIGGILLVFSVLWHLYRIIRGWIALSDGRAV
ncbi:DUF4870 family protein [Psychrobacter sp. I-STPA10]|uniref:DUF4870 family protein n=1 Tax=Psychrobacter sp. I-STPA10 TaxID=2585769 RepID=UPI001E405DAB|nr:hypothetical protein [Psychrobacter sp. I-STPA10]